MISFNQRDYTQKLGFGSSSIAQDGCFLTVLSRIVSRSPADVNELLKKNGGFDGNWIIWQATAKALKLSIYRLLEIYDNYKVKSYLEQKKRVCVIVDGFPIGGEQHMVEYVGNQMCFDPWVGAIVPTSNYPTPLKVVVFEPFISEETEVKPSPTPVPSQPQYTKSEHDAAVEYDGILRELHEMKIIESPAREKNTKKIVLAGINKRLSDIENEKNIAIKQVQQARENDKIAFEREKKILSSEVVTLQKKLRDYESKPDPNKTIEDLKQQIKAYKENEENMQQTIEKYKSSTLRQLIYDIRQNLKQKKQ